MNHPVIAIFLLPLLFAACGDDPFRKIEELNSFRLLAVVADRPEINPSLNATVNLSVLVSDPQGNGRALAGNYQACLDPGVAYGADADCSLDPLASSGSINISGNQLNSANFYTDLTSAISISIDPALISGAEGRRLFNGINFLVVFTFIVDGQEHRIFKMLRASNKAGAELSTNPTGSTLNVAGATQLAPGTPLQVLADNSKVYPFWPLEGEIQNVPVNLAVAWYTSLGNFSRAKTSSQETTTWLHSEASSNFLVLAIVRDNWGGVEIVRLGL